MLLHVPLQHCSATAAAHLLQRLLQQDQGVGLNANQ